MKEDLQDNRIRIAKPHAQGTGGHSTEFTIPKEFCERYGINKHVHLMLVPEQDFFKVMKLRLAVPGETE